MMRATTSAVAHTANPWAVEAWRTFLVAGAGRAARRALDPNAPGHALDETTLRAAVAGKTRSLGDATQAVARARAVATGAMTTDEAVVVDVLTIWALAHGGDAAKAGTIVDMARRMGHPLNHDALPELLYQMARRGYLYH